MKSTKILLVAGSLLFSLSAFGLIAHASVSNYTTTSVEHYQRYSYIDDGGNGYYKIGGKKFNSNEVNVVKHTPQRKTVSITVKRPQIKANLTKAQQANLRTDLQIWTKNNTYVVSPFDISLMQGGQLKHKLNQSTKKLFANYQKVHTDVVINK